MFNGSGHLPSKAGSPFGGDFGMLVFQLLSASKQALNIVHSFASLHGQAVQSISWPHNWVMDPLVKPKDDAVTDFGCFRRHSGREAWSLNCIYEML